MNYASVHTSALGTNTYILYGDGEALLIDPGIETEPVRRFLDAHDLAVTHVLLTHTHADHAASAAYWQAAGALVYVGADEAPLNNARDSAADLLGVEYVPYRPDVLLRDGDTVTFRGCDLYVLHTAGHTAGGLCFATDDRRLFSGDTLFAGSAGRTDLYTGDAAALRASLVRLAALGGDYDVYPGHGPSTTLDDERRCNPYMD